MEILSPKGVIAFAYQEGILQNESLWLEMLEARSQSSHDYGRDLAQGIAEEIRLRYCKSLTELCQYITAHLK